MKKMLANEIICCLNKAICFKSIHPTGTKNTSTLFYKQNFVSIFMISFDDSLFESKVLQTYIFILTNQCSF